MERLQRLDVETQLVEKLRAVAAQFLRRDALPLFFQFFPAEKQVGEPFIDRHSRLPRYFALEGFSQREPGRQPAALDGALGHLQKLGGLGLAQALVP